MARDRSGHRCADSGLDVGMAVEERGFELAGERNWGIFAGYPLYRCFEFPKQRFVDSGGDLRTDTKGLHRLVHDYRSAGLLDRGEDGVHVERGDGTKIDNLAIDAIVGKLVTDGRNVVHRAAVADDGDIASRLDPPSPSLV